MALYLSPRIIIAAGWFGLSGCFFVLIGIEYSYWFEISLGIAAIVGAVGAIVNRKWSQWVVYSVAAVIIGTWLYDFGLAWRAGRISYEKIQSNPLWFIPNFLLLIPTIWSTDIVRRRFATPRRRPNKSLERTRGR
jgi:hypothetical protein